MDDSTMPWQTRYDWIEVYDYDAATDDFVWRWRDNFEELDLDRWRVSNGWSYESNSSLFMKENTFIDNGKLVL